MLMHVRAHNTCMTGAPNGCNEVGPQVPIIHLLSGATAHASGTVSVHNEACMSGTVSAHDDSRASGVMHMHGCTCTGQPLTFSSGD